MNKTALSLLASISLAALSSCSSHTPDTSLTSAIKAWTKDGDDTKARIALRNATHKAAVSDNRKNHEADLLYALENTNNIEVKEFIIHELKLIGGTSSIEPLSKYILHAKLSSHTTQALLAINNSVQGEGDGLISGQTVADVFSDALPDASGEDLLYLIKTIGSLGEADSSAMEIIESHCQSEDKVLKHTSVRTLAEIADEDSAETLLNAIKGEKHYNRSKMISLNLLFARKLGDSEGETHALKVMSSVDKNKEDHLYIKCLSTLQDIKGNDFTDDLISYLGDENLRISYAIVNILAKTDDSSINSKLESAFSQASPLFQAQALKVLVKRKSAKASFLTGKALSSNDQYVRSTAALLSIHANVDDTIDGLVQLLLKGTDEDKKMAVSALNRIPAKKCSGSLINAYRKADNQAKASILSIMAMKKDSAIADIALQATLLDDKKVKKEAYKALKNIATFNQVPQLIEMVKNNENSSDLKGLQGALVTSSWNKENEVATQVVKNIQKGSSAKSNLALVQVLSRIGGTVAFKGLRELYNVGSEAVQKETVRTLAKWSSLDQINELIRITSKTEGSNTILMLRGLSSLIVNSGTDANHKKNLLQKLSGLAPNSDEKKKILDLKNKLQ